MCIFAFGLFDKLKNKIFSSFSYFAKKVSGHDICCVPFSESACKTENIDTKYDIEFRILSIRQMHWTTQSLNLASDVEAWCTVRPSLSPYGVIRPQWVNSMKLPEWHIPFSTFTSTKTNISFSEYFIFFHLYILHNVANLHYMHSQFIVKHMLWINKVSEISVTIGLV